MGSSGLCRQSGRNETFKRIRKLSSNGNRMASHENSFCQYWELSLCPGFCHSYGSKLADKKAVGKLLCYYYDIHGNIIKSDLDCTMQIPLEILAKRKFVVGICGSNVHHKALTGALKTGIFTHIVASKEILERVLIEIEKKEGIKPYI